MDYKKERLKIIAAAEKSLIELRKVATQRIDLEELDVEKAKTAAAAKRLAVEDSFAILSIIEQQEGLLTEETQTTESKDFFGVENRVS